MPLNLSIPDAALDTLLKLSEASESERSELMEALKTTPPSFGASAFSEAVQEKVSLDKGDVDEYVKTIFNIYFVYDYTKEDVNAVAEAVVHQLESKFDASSPEKEQLLSLRDFLSEVLSLQDTLGVSAKSIRIMTQHEHVFQGAEIFSDARSIFRTDDPSVSPVTSVLFHSLKVTYREGDTRKEFFVALDALDLEQLSETVNRALQKHQSLRKTLKSAGIEILEPSPER